MVLILSLYFMFFFFFNQNSFVVAALLWGSQARTDALFLSYLSGICPNHPSPFATSYSLIFSVPQTLSQHGLN
jgi:uracil DNA glycosylase